ncbi:DUF4105 domain-containing protein [Syntrophorhabdus aromaticivorans]|jgi:hypothetical protein|nr:DUF4105 domain-containing protein [Syntrophorhabdus aromaticivorans]HBA55324.1 DUF4105 domain-containing protein [Syntrophorhabdus aromaticivorans]
MRKFIRCSVIVFLFIAIGLMTAWASLAIYYSDLGGESLRTGLAVLFAAGTIGAFAVLSNRCRTLAGFFVVFALIAAWWMTIPPSNDRAWQPEVAILPYASINGDLVTIHNIRNFRYRTERDFDALYYDRTFDLARLHSVDLIAVYWMGEAIAHIMMSFGFDGGNYVAFSIETRKTQGEEYSTIKGFFKQYELIYIAGDERDLIRVRTDFRNPREDVYLYRTRIPKEKARQLFAEYVKQINKMKRKPEWYNTLTTNCTTNIVRHVRAFGGRARYTWKILLSGYTPQYAYELGGLDTTISFAELKKMSYINPTAHIFGNDPEFSGKIRAGLPVPGR